MAGELRPSGVPLKALGELGTFIRGAGIQKKDLVDSGVPAIHYGEIHTHYGLAATVTRSFVASELGAKLRKAEPGDLVIATTSEDDEAVGKAVAWLGDAAAAVSSDAYIYRHSLVPKYASYLFQSRQFRDQKMRWITGTKVRRLAGDNLAKIVVPVPPSEVQEEIVRILDSFSSLQSALDVQLDAELAARRRQYAYYRNSILHSKAQKGRKGRIVKLDQVSDILVGFAFKSSRFSDSAGDTRLLRGDNIGQGRLKPNIFKRWKRAVNDSLERYELRTDDVVLAMDRPWIPAGFFPAQWDPKLGIHVT